MVSRIPVVLAIDVEPDHRQVEPDVHAPWTGFERMEPYLQDLRGRLAAATATTVHWTWFVRVDEQVRVTYGCGAWALHRYAEELARLRRAGDEVGAHVHAYRWDEVEAAWVIDHTPAWIASLVRKALAWFDAAAGRRCRSFRFGDHWMDDPTLQVLESEGVGYDLTLEPGMPAMPGVAAGERHVGTLPDYDHVPVTPHRRAAINGQAGPEATMGGLWVLPVSTGRLPPVVAPLMKAYRFIRRRRGHTVGVVALNPTLPPPLFRRLAGPRLTHQAPACLVLPLRSDGGLSPRLLARVTTNLDFLVRASDGRVQFVTPASAVAHWQSAMAER